MSNENENSDVDQTSLKSSPSGGSSSFVKKEASFEDTTSFSSEPELPQRKKFYKWRRAIMRIPFLVFWLVLLWIGAKIVWRESRYAESTSAMLVGNLIEIRAPFTTELSAVFVQEGDLVKENEMIAQLNATHLEHQLNMLLELKEIKQEEPKAIESEILEEQNRSIQFTEASMQREAMFRTELERMKIQVDFAKEKEDRLLEAYELNTIPYIDVAESTSDRRALEKDILLTQQRLLLQKLITSNAKQGRLFSESFQMFGKTKQLKSTQASLASELNALDMEISELKEQINCFKITSLRKGRIFSVNAHWGTRVRAGEPLLTIESEDEIFALGWFKFDEAQKIGYDTEAEVIIPSIKQTFVGRVTSVGQAAFSGLEGFEKSNVAESREVAVKIRFDKQAPDFRTGLRARIRVKHDDPL